MEQLGSRWTDFHEIWCFEHFSKICGENSSYIKSDKNNGHFTWRPVCICDHTYLLTPWCRVLPEQLTGLQLVKKFPAFHGTYVIIRHWILLKMRNVSVKICRENQNTYFMLYILISRFNACVKSILLFGCETWLVTKDTANLCEQMS